MRHYYTLVLRSHLRLMDAHFIKDCSGLTLDILARGPVWNEGLDYKCGTGHGVGFILNVHEGPHNLRYRLREGDYAAPIVPGMVITDEPGLYIENEFGIRIENELLCVDDQVTSDGTFYCFEPITYAPYDLDAVNVEELERSEKETLNRYNKMVYEKISPYLTEEEKEWLAHETREV